MKRRQAAGCMAAILLAGCGNPAPAPKPVATVVEACAAARAYVAYRKATAHTVVMFPQTTSTVGAAPAQTSGLRQAGTTRLPGFAKGDQAIVFSLPADCLAGLAQTPAASDSPGARFGTDFALPPALSEDCRQATILANERCDDRRCLGGALTYLHKDAAGVWTVVSASPAWIS